jgi:hypothetical protein
MALPGPVNMPLRHPVSSLSLGLRGRTQVTNFAGPLYLAAAAGLTQTAGPEAGSRAEAGLAGVAATAVLGAAAFATDPVSGYAPGVGGRGTRADSRGTLHNLCGAGFFLGLPAAAFAGGWRALRQNQPGWGLYCAGTAAAMLAAAGGYRSVTPVCECRRPAPARRHRDRVRLADGPAGAGAETGRVSRGIRLAGQ